MFVTGRVCSGDYAYRKLVCHLPMRIYQFGFQYQEQQILELCSIDLSIKYSKSY